MFKIAFALVSVFVLRLVLYFAVSFDLELAVKLVSRPDLDFVSALDVGCRLRCLFSSGLEVELVFDIELVLLSMSTTLCAVPQYP